LEFTGPDGVPHPSAQLIQISNNPYLLSRVGGFGTRPSLETGHLGVAVAEVRSAAELAELVALEAAGQIRRFGGWLEWETPRFEVRSSRPVEAGVDGEALKLEPPLEFRSLPAAIRVRIPTNAPGLSPAARSIPSAWWMITTMLRTVAGRPAAGPPASGEGIGAPSREHAR
jgi:diacylglycerol kinase family enzyme